MTVTTTLPREVAEQLSAVAKADGKSEEAIVSQAVIEYLASRRFFNDKADVLTQLESLLAKGIESGEAFASIPKRNATRHGLLTRLALAFLTYFAERAVNFRRKGKEHVHRDKFIHAGAQIEQRKRCVGN